MIALSNRTTVALASALLLAGIFLAGYAAETQLLFLPVAMMAGLFLLQYPRLLFYALVASIPWSFEARLSEGLATDLPDEPLMLLTALAAVALWLTKARSNGTAKFHPLLFLLFVSFCWLVITVAASTFPVFSLKYLAAKSWYLLAFVAAPLLVNGDKALVSRSALLLFLSMFAVTLVTLYHHAQLGFTFAKVNDALQPFFRNHVNYSALLVLTTPLLVAFFRRAKSAWLRTLLVLAFLVVTAALYLSYSRGAWLAFFIGLAGFWLVKKGWLFRFFTGLVVVVVLGVSWLQYKNNYLRFAPDHNSTIFHENFSEHLAATYKGKDVSTAERFYRWVAGARMSGDAWATGFGPTTFYPNYKPFAVPLFRTWVSDNKEKSTVHNYFLLLLVEQGTAGLLLFLLLVGAMFWYAQKIYRRTADPFWKTTAAVVGAVLLMQCTLNFLSDLVETDKVGSVFYLCVAVLVIAGREGGRKNEEGSMRNEE